MIRRLTLLLALLIGSAALAGTATPPSSHAWSPRDGFVVHEWGTFSHFAGANGEVVDGLGAEEEKLPNFVHTFGKMRGVVTDHVMPTKGGVNVQQVFQKMETPVIYFYTPKRQKVTVDVAYRRGVLSEWFPQVASYEGLGPMRYQQRANPAAARSDAAIKLKDLQSSKVRWLVDVLATGAARPGRVPAVDPTDPWDFARNVAASWLYGGSGKKEAERYIFYRGLSAETRTPALKALPGGKVELTQGNHHAHFTKAFLLSVHGDRAGMVPVAPMKAGDKATYVLQPNAKKADVVADIKRQVLANLIASGLYADEARAMVKTWTRSWFEKDGQRLIYLVNPDYVNWMLPLTIDPVPAKVVRTFVGRLDFLTPEKEAALERAVRDSGSTNAAAAEASRRELATVGRFVEPALRRILAVTKDTQTRTNARALLARVARTQP